MAGRFESRVVRSVGVLLCLTLGATGCTTARILRYNYSGVGDHKIFPAREIERGSEILRLKEPAPERAEAAAALFAGRMKIDGIPADRALEQRGVLALIVLQGDTLVYERYFHGTSQRSIVPSFSVAKSFVSALVGIAIAEDKIEGVNQAVTDFVSELRPLGFDRVTILHLLQMRSGIKFSESYGSPFSDAAAFYYGTDLRDRLTRLTLEHEPGTVHSYRSVDTLLLGLILERATGMSLSEYLESRIWRPLGMEFDASWSLDREEGGIEKTFCCLNARARDYARFGLLYLNRGEANGRRIVPESWVEESIVPVHAGGRRWRYGYQWWLGNPDEGDYLAEGLHGQFIYVSPMHRTVIVMLSKKHPGATPSLFADISRALR